MKKYQTMVNNENETIKLAESLGNRLFSGSVITLDGTLGAGKTTFTKGIAKGLNIKQTVNSPSFTIIKEYEGTLPLYHMDVYRLDDDGEDLGFDEYFYGHGVVVIEWPKQIESQLPPERLDIVFTVVDEEKRLLKFIPKGNKYEQLCEVLFNEKLIN